VTFCQVDRLTVVILDMLRKTLRRLLYGTVIFVCYLTMIRATFAAKDDASLPKGSISDVDNRPYAGGKRYGMIILKTGTELLGNIEITEKGSILMTENQLLGDSVIGNEEVKSIRWLKRIVIRLKSQEVVFGHLIRKQSDHLLIETIFEPKTIKKIPLSIVDDVKEAFNEDLPRKESKYPRIALGGGWLVAIGDYAPAFQGGPNGVLSLTQTWKTWFRWSSKFIPDLRFDAIGIQFKNAANLYQAVYFLGGPQWTIDPFVRHPGIFYISAMAGVALEKGNSAYYSGSNQTMGAKISLGYDYFLTARFLVGAELQGIYSYDQVTPLFAVGANLRFGFAY
jgi:hypothetical protein